MGLLDDIRPQTRKPAPKEIAVAGRDLAIEWDDGRRSRLPMTFVRSRCPCAACVDEWTGRRTLDPATIPADIHPWGFTEVGRYALQVEWSDRHASGLYSWELLRRIDDEFRASAPTAGTA